MREAIKQQDKSGGHGTKLRVPAISVTERFRRLYEGMNGHWRGSSEGLILAMLLSTLTKSEYGRAIARAPYPQTPDRPRCPKMGSRSLNRSSELKFG